MAETKNLAEALAQFQAKLPAITKSKTAKVKGQTKDGRPFEYEYKYADLAEISAVVLPLLGSVGLSFTARPTYNEAGRFVLAYTLQHGEAGELVGEYPLPQSGTAQEIGSAITYARRYALCSVVGVAPDEDDDGQAASTKPMRVNEPVQQWDPMEQEVLVTAWTEELRQANDADEISAIGQKLLKAKRSGELSPNSYAHLAKAGAARKAELNGGAHGTG